MDFEKNITENMGIPGFILGVILSLWKLFKFFISRSLIEIKNRVENIEKDIETYKKITDRRIEIIISKDKEIEVNKCILDIEHITRDVKDNKRQLGAMWQRIEKENKELGERISDMEGYLRGKRENKK